MESYGPGAALMPLHVMGGILGLISGYIALVATKGQSWHRRSGMVFVSAMVVMSLSGAVVAAVDNRNNGVSIVAGVLAFYLVTTAMLTVRPRPGYAPALDRIAMIFAGTLSVFCAIAAVDMARRGRPEAYASVMFAVVAAAAAIGDRRVLRAGRIAGVWRLRRHLWRMCFAMWIAAASFFWGPQGRVPEALRIPVLQAFCVLLPIGVMVYWLWRTRSRSARLAMFNTEESLGVLP
jgi:hypothetical protein